MSGENIQAENIPVREMLGEPDRAEPVVERFEQPREAPVREEPQEERRPTGPYEDKRAAMYEKARQQREESEAENGLRVMDDAAERGRVPPGTETFADREARRSAQQRGEERPSEPEAPVERVEPSRRVVKVQGQTRELTDEELVAAAQKGLASETVLEDAKRLKAQLQQELAEVQSRLRADHSPTQPDPAQPRAAKSEDTKPDDAELDDIIDGIQVGDREEAKAALRKQMMLSEQRILNQIGDLDQRVAATIQQVTKAETFERSVTERIGAAISDFHAENPDFKGEMRERLLAQQTQMHMERALVEAGAPSDLIDTFVLHKSRELGRPIGRGEAAAFAFKAALAHGVELPEYRDLLRRAGDDIRTGLGLPKPSAAPPQQAQAPSNFAAEREERKASIQQQPKRANVVPGSEASQRSDDDKRRDWIQQRRMMLKGRR